MSTDITPLEEGKLPSYLKEVKDDATLAIAGESGFKRISTRGSVFRMMEGGQEIASSDERSMKVVIVNAAPATGRTFYEGAYGDGENKSPTCFSEDSLKPDESVEKPQAMTCGDCPHNIAGSGQGGKGRACKFSHKIAVVLADALDGDVFAMQISAISLFGKAEGNAMPLKAYGKYLKAMNYPISAVVTEMKFDKNSPVPKLLFRAVGALKQDQFAISQRQSKSAAALRAIKPKQNNSEMSEPVKVDKKKVEEKSKKLNDVLDEFDD
jgi:hypothetical protein